MYKKLVTALCQEHGIPLIKVDSNMSWASGLVSARSTRRARPGRSSSAPRLWYVTGVARDLRMMCCRTTSRPTSNLPSPRPTCSRDLSKTSQEPCHDMSVGLRALKTETKTSDFELNQLG